MIARTRDPRNAAPRRRPSGPPAGGASLADPGPAHASAIAIDPFRAIRFPNAIREQRRRAGVGSLLALAHRLPTIPYIRLSKIERGEVVAKAGELWLIAAALGLDDPARLLVDVAAPDFSTALWAGLAGEHRDADREAEELAMLLAAAVRMRRAGDSSLTLARIQADYGLASVIVSRIENAAKPFGRWNGATLDALAALLGATDRPALVAQLREDQTNGRLASWLARIPGAAAREERTRARVAELRRELRAGPTPDAGASPPHSPPTHLPAHTPETPPSAPPERLTVLGVPVGDGVIELFPNPQQVVPPPGSGPRCYALRMGRASLGAAIPGQAILIVDPDRTPVQGGLAVLRVEGGVRALIVATDREGRLHGYSSNPEKDIPLDAVAPEDLALVTAILLA